MPAISKVMLTGGSFQDAEGNLLSGGYLWLKLSQDENVNDSEICSGVEVKILLDGYGSVIAGQFVWGNDQMLPVNSFYKVTGYTANGQVAFGPNNQQVIGSGGTFDVGTWVPNLVISWIPPLQSVSLEVNGVLASSQVVQNLVDSATVAFTDNGGGNISASAAIPSVPPFATGTPNLGDTWRYNEYGDSKWDIVIGVPRFVQFLPPETLPGNIISIGSAVSVGNICVGGTPLVVTGTATEPLGTIFTSYNTANTNVLISVNGPGGQPGPPYHSFGTVRRASQRVLFSDTANCRYWVGLSNVEGMNGADFAKDVPTPAGFPATLKYAAFRYSAGTDTKIKAICGFGTNATSAQTIVDTGVSVDTSNSMWFEIIPGATTKFYINGVLVASISTNNLIGTDLVRAFWCGDNKNTNNAVSANWYNTTMTIR